MKTQSALILIVAFAFCSISMSISMPYLPGFLEAIGLGNLARWFGGLFNPECKETEDCGPGKYCNARKCLDCLLSGVKCEPGECCSGLVCERRGTDRARCHRPVATEIGRASGSERV